MNAPHPRPSHRSIYLPDEAATARLARALAGRAQPGDVIALGGDLGSGKTAFARAFINALAPAEGDPTSPTPEEVPSPTFTLVQIYDRQPAPVWHFDLYRLERPEEAFELGIEEALADAITLIEWPERLGALLPADRLDVTLHFAVARQGIVEGARRAEISGPARWRLDELPSMSEDAD